MDNANIPYQIGELIFHQLRNENNEKENEILQKWIDENPANRALFEKIVDEENINRKLKKYANYNTAKAWQSFINKIDGEAKEKRRILPRILRYAATLSIPLLIGGYLFFSNIVKERRQLAEFSKIQPGLQKAILSLSNGDKIELDNATDKDLILEHKVKILDKNNLLVYEKEEQIADEIEDSVMFNSLETLNGGEYLVVLADGSKVWLSAATKLTYPTEFIGNTRNVQIEGEAYFEVAENKEKPFIVNVANIDITVLGTSFNVMAYNDEKNIVTTLVEGKVKLNAISDNLADQLSINLIPGEQALYEKETKVLESRKVDPEIYTAWREGFVLIDYERLEDLMRRLSRWYNFEPEFKVEAIKDYHFSGRLNRYDEIYDILKLIALTTNVSFEASDNKIIISKNE